jgi:hypothetical protein
MRLGTAAEHLCGYEGEWLGGDGRIEEAVKGREIPGGILRAAGGDAEGRGGKRERGVRGWFSRLRSMRLGTAAEHLCGYELFFNMLIIPGALLSFTS